MTNVVVVDLDGSLCSVNTFRWWMIFSSCFLLLSIRWVSLYKVQNIVIQRLLNKTNRIQMKHDILAETEGLPSGFVAWFCSFLHKHTNQNVIAEMRRYESCGTPVVLCTAAPSCYVDTYASKFNLSHVFSTPSVIVPDWKEVFGARKLEVLEEYFGSDFSLECVITDHHDDLPLLLKAERRLLVSPSRVTLDRINGLFDFDIIQDMGL